MTGSSGTGPARTRPSIDERAARRAAMETPGRDRYDALLRHLQAGRQLPVQPRRRRALELDIHPYAGRIVLGFLVLVLVWLAAIAVTDLVRRGRVDTWTNAGVPDPGVQSGLTLSGCPAATFQEDVYFPAWLRFEGKVFVWKDSLLPIGPNSVGRSFLETGYRNGDLELYRVESNPEGRAGRQVMLRQGESPVGAVYVQTSCA